MVGTGEAVGNHQVGGRAVEGAQVRAFVRNNSFDGWKMQDKKVFVYVGTHAFYHGLDTLI